MISLFIIFDLPFWDEFLGKMRIATYSWNLMAIWFILTFRHANYKVCYAAKFQLRNKIEKQKLPVQRFEPRTLCKNIISHQHAYPFHHNSHNVLAILTHYIRQEITWSCELHFSEVILAMMVQGYTRTLDNRWETLMPIRTIWAKFLGLCLMPSGQNQPDFEKCLLDCPDVH